MHFYAELKAIVEASQVLAKDAIHIYIGLICLLFSASVLRRSLASYAVLLLGVVVSFVLEALDLRYSYVMGDPLDWAASAHDMINTSLLPYLFVAAVRLNLVSVRA